MRTYALLAALGLALLAAAPGGARADGQCGQVPNVGGLDQSPTSPSNWGKCTSALESFVAPGSHWCKFGELGTWPAPPTDKAKKCLKFGRSTIYRGPIYGSSSGHKAACNKWLQGDDNYAMVAVSTKYLKTYEGGWAASKGACDKCMCIRMHGGDDKFNTGLQKEHAQKSIGLTFMGKVGDRCSECEDDHIDLLQDRPLSFAPFDPKVENNNYNAPYVNAKDGLRGLNNPQNMRGGAEALENAGAWTVDWQWVPCGWSHNQCANLMKGMGYKDVWTPRKSEGVDSFSMRPVSQLRADGALESRLFKEPWTKK
ncbi:MAG: hypothetical protein J3K34DRAFT_439029 [Monoraphidium minutum]|nr:MAG: hypothetical protein J3K34DRAFT_439029 [Monoraphidium minutum]